MKRFSTFLTVLLTSLALALSTANVAHAKKFGGGKSFGIKKNSSMFERKATQPKAPTSKPAQAAPNNTAPAAGAGAATAGKTAAASGASKWMGPLAGLAAGGLLAAMLFGDGFEGFAMMDFLLFLGLAVLGFFLLKRMMAGRAQQQPNYGAQMPQPTQQREMTPEHVQMKERQTVSEPVQAGQSMAVPTIGSGLSDSVEPVAADDMPAWFEADAFVEGSKTNFVNLQAAWDSGDMSEIRPFLSAELAAAIEIELANRGDEQNVTIVEEVNAEMAHAGRDGDQFVVSIQFSGWIKEGENADSESFQEVWHIARDWNGEGAWQVAGIQQI